jgi:hypothetical protein
MARFSGKVGYGQNVDQGGGIWKTQIVEKSYRGDVTRNYRRNADDEKVNDNLRTSTQISIVSDSYANEHFSAIRYVEWAGALWKVTSVNEQRPRLILELGGVYNGPRPA